MFNDRVAPRYQIEMSIGCVMDPNLVRTHVEVTIFGLVDETGSTHTPSHELTISDVLQV